MNKREVHARPGRRKELVTEDKVFKSANDWELTEDEKERARVELGETEEKKEGCLRELKERLSKDEETNYRMDDSYLLRFLRFRKYNTDEAYKNVARFYGLKKKKPDYFILSPDLKSLMDLNFITCLPYLDEKGRIITLLNLESWKPEEKPFEEMIQSVCALYDIITMNAKAQINGIIIIADVKGLSMTQFTELFRKNRLSVFVPLIQNGYPYRFKKGIVINTNPIMRMLYAMIRPLLRKKVAERVFLLGSDPKDLHEHVNPLLLPTKYEGGLEKEEYDVTQLIMDNLPYLQYERSFT